MNFLQTRRQAQAESIRDLKPNPKEKKLSRPLRASVQKSGKTAEEARMR